MIPERLRRYFASSAMWASFVLLYVAFAGILLLGLILMAQSWWSAVGRHGSAWVLGYKSARVILIALAFVFLAAQPVIQLFSRPKKDAGWRVERRSGERARKE
jgi:hypothetical protein